MELIWFVMCETIKLFGTRAGNNGSNHGVWITNGSKIRIHNNIFHRLYNDGIHIDSVGECEIVGNFFTYLGQYCVRGAFDGVKCNDNWYWSQGQIDWVYLWRSRCSEYRCGGSQICCL